VGHHTTRDVGRQAEQRAFDFLVDLNLRPVARNFHSRGGEIDLIMLDEDCLAFIEVRYRLSAAFAPASHTVDRHKQNKIIRTAAMFIARNHRFARYTMRFDVIAVEGSEKVGINWIKDAFRPINSTL
jgi:putative endonuclease